MAINCSGIIHTVKSGETLWKISQIYGVNLSEVISINPSLSDPNNLQIGQEICIPKTNNQSIRESLSYLFGGTTTDYLNYLSVTKNSITTVCTDSFELLDDGNLLIVPSNKLNADFIKTLQQQGIKVTPFLSNNWDRTLGFTALDNRESLSSQIAESVINYNLDGVNIDIENVTEQYRTQYVDFMRLLREKLPNKIVSIAVAANPNGWTKGWHGSYDYKALSEYCDYLVIMAYDESYQGSAEGPVSSSSFFNRSIQYALNQKVPKEKIVVGIPFFGRYWKIGNASGGIGIADIDIKNLLLNYASTSRFDETTKSAFAEVTINTDESEPIIWGGRKLTAGTYHIWYDNEESTKYKLEVINNNSLRGVGSWALGQENPSIWDFYTKVLNGNQYDIPSNSEGGNKDMTQQETLEFIYPVGSIYMSVSDKNPGTLFGGTWVRWGNGRTIIAVNENDSQGNFNVSEEVGGNREHRHDFRIGMHWWYGAAAGENAPNGTGAYRYYDGQYDGWARNLSARSMIVNNANYNTIASTVANPDGKYSNGDTSTANNLPPYITCYIWKRIN